MIVMGQFTNIIPETLCVWTKERKFSASVEAGKFADDSLQARGASIKSTMSSQLTEIKPEVSVASDKCLICQKIKSLGKRLEKEKCPEQER